MSPGFIGVSAGTWAVPHTPDPPPGDYLAVLIADDAPWRMSNLTGAWETFSGLNSLRVATPPGLPAIWYAWRNNPPNSHLYKSSNNGTSWTQLASDPFTPDVPSGGIYTHWPDHLIAATVGILITAKWSSQTTLGALHLKNIYYSTDDGASWSQVYASDLADGNASAWGRENLVANTVYSWYLSSATGVTRISHGGGLGSETAIALPSGSSWDLVNMLACDSSLDGEIVYAVAHKTGENKQRVLRASTLTPTQFVDISPPFDLLDVNLGDVWIAVAGDVIMAAAYGLVDPNDTGSIWRSTNAGLTWTRVFNWSPNLNGFGTFSGVKAVGVNPHRPQTWFVWANNHEDIGSRVYRTLDQGATWVSVPLPSADPLGDNDQLYFEVRVLG